MCVETAELNECNVHVDCDMIECEALKQPRTLEDYKLAYEHWRSHSWLHGCAHGS